MFPRHRLIINVNAISFKDINSQHRDSDFKCKTDKLSLVTFPPTWYAEVKILFQSMSYTISHYITAHFLTADRFCSERCENIPIIVVMGNRCDLSACIEANRATLSLHAKSFVQDSNQYK